LKESNPNTEDDIIYFGPGLKNEEIDESFSKLYGKLLDYIKSIFELVEQFCPGCDNQVRLALNIAEMDSNLMQRLVSKECEKRIELMKMNASYTSQIITNNATNNDVNQIINARLLNIEKRNYQEIT
jgi:hypothetical protein